MTGQQSSMRTAALCYIVLQFVTAVLAANGEQQSSDQCTTLQELCDNPALTGIIEKVATGKDTATLFCQSSTFPTAHYQWYFTKTTLSEGSLLLIDGNKYAVSGIRSQFLAVKKITQQDEGLYYCKEGNSDDPVLGGCLYAYSPVKFTSCSGEMSPELGCSTVEDIHATTRDISVDFDTSLSHNSTLDSCHNQSILTVQFHKVDSDLEIRCADDVTSCYKRGAQAQRFIVFRKSARPFDIAISLANLTVNDSGEYRVQANLAHPGNYIVTIRKSFVLHVTDVHFEMGGSSYGNNSVVSIHSIGERENALLCMTNRNDCCQMPSNGGEAKTPGEFFFPNGTKIPVQDLENGGLYRHQGYKHISLNRKEGVKFPAGKYSCEILDASGDIQEIYVYLSDNKN